MEAIYILLKHSISSNDLTKAAKLLKHFCIRIEELYGSRYETYNVHCLLHLVDRVKDLGPLWTHSCFCFEDFNGELRHFFHGTQHIEMPTVNLTIAILGFHPRGKAAMLELKTIEFFSKNLHRNRI